MGFSVTASHVVFFIAFLTAGSVAAGAFWATQTKMEDARRLETARLDSAIHTNITIVGTPTYDAGNSRYTFQVENVGSTVLNLTRFAFLVDGVVTTSIENETIAGVTSTGYLLPGDTMTVNLKPVAPAPTDLKVTTEYGTSAYYRS